MGQHKTNPTAKLAAAGLIDKKKPKMGKRESERLIERLAMDYLFGKFFEDKKID